MNLIEFIGFIVSLLAMLVLMVKKRSDERRRRANPEEYERQEMEQADKLKSFLKSINEDMENDEHLNPEVHRKDHLSPASVGTFPQVPKQTSPSEPHRIAGDQGHYKFTTKIEERKLQTNSEKHRLKSSLSGLDKNYKFSTGSQTVSTDMIAQNERDAYSLKKPMRINRAAIVLSHLKSRKDMVILHEVISAPKGLR